VQERRIALGDWLVTQSIVSLALELGAGCQKCVASAALSLTLQSEDSEHSSWSRCGPTKAYKLATIAIKPQKAVCLGTSHSIGATTGPGPSAAAGWAGY
jgi:hypothetical protein